jgi:hypothetical protein
MQMKFRVEEEDRGLGNLIASLRAISSSKEALYVGVQFPNRRYKTGQSVGLVGMVHEFGAPSSSPPTTEKRWLRGTFERNKNKYADIIEKVLGQALDSGRNISARSVFLTLGPVIRGDLRESIKSIDLIDTGLLLRSVGFRIAKETDE